MAILELPRGRVADEAVALRLEERLVVVLDCRLERRLLVEFAAVIGLKENARKKENKKGERQGERENKYAAKIAHLGAPP